jgi:hypothetical protein
MEVHLIESPDGHLYVNREDLLDVLQDLADRAIPQTKDIYDFYLRTITSLGVPSYEELTTGECLYALPENDENGIAKKNLSFYFDPDVGVYFKCDSLREMATYFGEYLRTKGRFPRHEVVVSCFAELIDYICNGAEKQEDG